MNLPDRVVTLRRLRALSTVAVLGLVAACSGTPHQDAVQETARYVAHAKHNYTPPGPPEDPWGPYIREASGKFDMPEIWIRSLMRVESGGNEYQDGQLITSGVGAMGLMQVMPETYDELRDRHNLGDDPFDPHDNIMAGVAYMREMYEIYGSPGFLAAYNAGPARLDDYLANLRPLPDETRHYVAMIGPYLRGSYPASRSAADGLAMNALPIDIPPGRRYGHPFMLASGRHLGSGRAPQPVQLAAAPLPTPPHRIGPLGAQRYAMIVPPPVPSAPPQPAPRGGFHLIATANAADSAPARRGPVGPGQWAIQIGAFANSGLAHGAIHAAQEHAHVELAIAHPFVSSMRQGRMLLWRARMTGMSRETAVQACEKMSRTHASCIVLSPEAQS